MVVSSALALKALKFIGPIAFDLAEDQFKKYVQGKVEQEIIETVYQRVILELDRFIASIVERTKIYIGLTAIVLAVVLPQPYLSVPAWLTWATVFFVLGVLGYMTYQFLRNLSGAMSVMTDYEEILKRDIAEELAKAKAESIKKKLALWYSGDAADQYFHFVISQIVRAFCAWISENKWHIYVRFICYFLAAVSFSYSLRALELG